MREQLMNLLLIQCKHDFLVDKLEELGIGLDKLRVDVWNDVISIIGVSVSETEQEFMREEFYELYLTLAKEHFRLEKASSYRMEVIADDEKVKEHLGEYIDTLYRMAGDKAKIL